jgi:preprotein translocase subunit SecE
MANLSEYLKETRAEMKHVTWPTRSQAIYYTIVVILISLGTAAYLGLLDYVFSLIVQKFI